MLYGDNYGYLSSLNPMMVNHLKKKSLFLKNQIKLKKNDFILDIGSNDGTFLNFFINDKKSLWYGKSLYNLYKSAHTPWKWHKVLFKESKKLGLIYFSTSFDETSLKFLKQFNLPIHKVASFENTDLRLKLIKDDQPHTSTTS